MRRFVEDLRATGEVRDGLDTEEAADTVWLTNSPEVFVMLTIERGWTPDAYERWPVDTWTRLLLTAR